MRLIAPREHGVWGLLAGAALVGLPLGHGLAGCGLLVAGMAAVMTRAAWQAPGSTPGRQAALLVWPVLAIAGIAFTAVLALQPSWLGWMAVAVMLGLPGAVPPAGRPWWSSALAGTAAGALAGAVAAAGGAPLAWSAIGGTALAAHLACSVPLVRAQTRGGSWRTLAIDLHLAAFLAAVAAWACELIPSGIPLVFALGLARCSLMADNRTSMSGSPSKPSVIGMRELAWLPVLAAGVALAVRSGAC
jgi:hypothetical protein